MPLIKESLGFSTLSERGQRPLLPPIAYKQRPVSQLDGAASRLRALHAWSRRTTGIVFPSRQQQTDITPPIINTPDSHPALVHSHTDNPRQDLCATTCGQDQGFAPRQSGEEGTDAEEGRTEE